MPPGAVLPRIATRSSPRRGSLHGPSRRAGNARRRGRDPRAAANVVSLAKLLGSADRRDRRPRQALQIREEPCCPSFASPKPPIPGCTALARLSQRPFRPSLYPRLPGAGGLVTAARVEPSFFPPSDAIVRSMSAHRRCNRLPRGPRRFEVVIDWKPISITAQQIEAISASQFALTFVATGAPEFDCVVTDS